MQLDPCSKPNYQLKKGQDSVIKLSLVDEDANHSDVDITNSESKKLPFDLTGASEIDVILPKSDGTGQHFALTASKVAVLGALIGKLSLTVSAADAALLLTQANANIEVRVTIASKVTVFHLTSVIDILDPLFT